MIVLELKRRWFTAESTLGELYVDGARECFTLEDVVRPDGVKVPHETAIHAGSYDVVVDMSQRFKRMMPHILDVPMFDGIRIHWGNSDVDTDGCPVLGQTHPCHDFVGSSRDAFNLFFPKIQHCTERGICRIVITNEQDADDRVRRTLLKVAA